MLKVNSDLWVPITSIHLELLDSKVQQRLCYMLTEINNTQKPIFLRYKINYYVLL